MTSMAAALIRRAWARRSSPWKADDHLHGGGQARVGGDRGRHGEQVLGRLQGAGRVLAVQHHQFVVPDVGDRQVGQAPARIEREQRIGDRAIGGVAARGPRRLQRLV
jgi:hypothetical protein